VPGGPLTSKPTWSRTQVLDHVGFFPSKHDDRTGFEESNMNAQRIFGVLVMLLGVVLLIIGINASHSVTERVSSTFLGRFTHATTWYIVGGGVLAVLGALMAMFGLRLGGARRAS